MIKVTTKVIWVNIIAVLIFTLGCDSPGLERFNIKKKLRLEKENQRKIDCYNYYESNPYIISFSLEKKLRNNNGSGKTVFKINDVRITTIDNKLSADSTLVVLNKLEYQFYISKSQDIYFKTFISPGKIELYGLMEERNNKTSTKSQIPNYTFDVKSKTEYFKGNKLNDIQDCRQWNKHELLPILKAEKHKSEK